MSFERIESLVDSAASGAFERWAYNQFEEHEIDSAADDIDVFVGRLDLYDQLSLAEDWWEEVGGLSEAVKKSGLRSAIEYGASGEVGSRARELFREGAEAILQMKKDLETSYGKVALGQKDPFGWTPPVCCIEKEGLDGYAYRKVEGDINADVLSMKTDCGFTVYFVCYLNEDIK